jgi:hypothetical protein
MPSFKEALEMPPPVIIPAGYPVYLRVFLCDDDGEILTERHLVVAWSIQDIGRPRPESTFCGDLWDFCKENDCLAVIELPAVRTNEGVDPVKFVDVITGALYENLEECREAATRLASERPSNIPERLGLEIKAHVKRKGWVSDRALRFKYSRADE